MTRTRMSAALIAISVALAACGGGAAGTDDTVTGQQGTTSSIDAQDAGTVTTVAGSASDTVTKVSANTATADEIAAALEAAGVDNADRWAREVLEYRPYDTGDPDLTHLRDELAKYNPGPGVIDLIVSALEP